MSAKFVDQATHPYIKVIVVYIYIHEDIFLKIAVILSSDLFTAFKRMEASKLSIGFCIRGKVH